MRRTGRIEKSSAATGFIGHSGFLDGQMLVAMPGMEDTRFARAVIYVCAHSEEGAMGIIINQPAVKVDYIAAVDWVTLEPVDVVGPGILFAVAAYVGKTRLIDNFVL